MNIVVESSDLMASRAKRSFFNSEINGSIVPIHFKAVLVILDGSGQIEEPNLEFSMLHCEFDGWVEIIEGIKEINKIIVSATQ